MQLTPGSKRASLNIKFNFEPDRLSGASLTNAYELALPIVAEPIQQMKKRRRTVDHGSVQMQLEVSNG